MDPSSVITQVSPDNNDASHLFTVQKGNGVNKKKRKKGPTSYAPLFAASARKVRNIKEEKRGVTHFLWAKVMEGPVHLAQEIYVPTLNKIVKVNQQSNYYLRS